MAAAHLKSSLSRPSKCATRDPGGAAALIGTSGAAAAARTCGSGVQMDSQHATAVEQGHGRVTSHCAMYRRITSAVAWRSVSSEVDRPGRGMSDLCFRHT